MGLDMYLYSDGRTVGYWRKANMIHEWFVDNVQNGVDNCKEYPVSTKQIEDLKALCEQVSSMCVTGKGKVINGYEITANGKIPMLEDGELIVNWELAEKLLPTKKGFFFGQTDYDSHYLKDVRETVKILDKALQNEGPFSYRSSW